MRERGLFMSCWHLGTSSLAPTLFASLVVLVKKKDGSLQMCIDYRAFNKKAMKNLYPIPCIYELMDEPRGAKFFTKID